MRYLSQSAGDIEAMLAQIGATSIDELFEQIPVEARPKTELGLPPPVSERSILVDLAAMAAENADVPAFCGAGLHPHYIPAAVDTLSLRGEFATAYTPYQPEVSQGTLQAIFEFQTMVSELLGLPYANASMYDGASALAEAVLMARRVTKREVCAVFSGLHPEYLETVQTYLGAVDGGSPKLRKIGTILSESGSSEHENPAESVARCIDRAVNALSDEMACVVIQSPSFFGELYDWSRLAAAARSKGILCIAVCTEPLSLALVKSPGEMGADIAVAEGMGLASAPTFGGPGVGLFALRDKKMLRQMPGRIAGETIDSNGRRGYVLTLSTREQHIRREKATSNICTNHGLIALRLAIHLSLLGRHGFVELARLNIGKRGHFIQHFEGRGCEIVPHFSFGEVLLESKGIDWIALVDRYATEHRLIPGVPLGRFDDRWSQCLLVSISELHSDKDIENLARLLTMEQSS